MYAAFLSLRFPYWQLYTAFDMQEVRHGELERDDECERDQILFHPDDSPAVIQNSAGKFR
jgi:hypothetical protein